MTTAAVGPGSAVLEVGCGTGQLTESLARYGFRLTAIDIGPSMIAAARRRLDGPAVSFQVSSFEDFAAAEASFDLIISGTAFHWVDPEVKFRKPALAPAPRRLARPAGDRRALRRPLRRGPARHVGRPQRRRRRPG